MQDKSNATFDTSARQGAKPTSNPGVLKWHLGVEMAPQHFRWPVWAQNKHKPRSAEMATQQFNISPSGRKTNISLVVLSWQLNNLILARLGA